MSMGKALVEGKPVVFTGEDRLPEVVWNGRHGGLKIRCLRVYEFESRWGHQE